MENLRGKKFNFLIPIKPLFKYRRNWVWKCKCDCGSITNVQASKLKNGSTKSCGCFKQKNIKPKFGSNHRNWSGYQDISKSFYNRIKQTAKYRGITFNINIKYLWQLYKKQNGKCAYTGKKIFLPIYVKQLRGENNENIASLDRIDNDKGYIKNNLHWICKRVNYMKHSMTEDYFFEWIKLIYKYRIK
jgi:hypothetical protein